MPLRISAILLATVALADAAAAEPVITETIKYYPVYGRDLLELRADIDKRRPKDASGEPRDGLTAWNARWRLATRTVPSGCEVAGVRVSASVIITLPKFGQPGPQGRPLSGARGVPSEVLQQVHDDMLKAFDTYQANLLAHERQHARIGAEVARRIEAALKALPSAPDCAALRAAANDAAQSLIEDAARQNEAYDLATRHGLDEGARLPP